MPTSDEQKLLDRLARAEELLREVASDHADAMPWLMSQKIKRFVDPVACVVCGTETARGYSVAGQGDAPLCDEHVRLTASEAIGAAVVFRLPAAVDARLAELKMKTDREAVAKALARGRRPGAGCLCSMSSGETCSICTPSRKTDRLCEAEECLNLAVYGASFCVDHR